MFSTRERLLKVLDFKPADRTLKWEFGYWGGAINRWYDEGLKKITGLNQEVEFGDVVFGPAMRWGSPSYGNSHLNAPVDKDISRFFNFDEQLMLVPYDYWIYPKFETEIIYEDDKFIEMYSETGIRQKVLKDGSSMPLWLDYPLKTRNDWEKIKEERFNINSISRRYSENFNEFLKKAKDPNRTFPLHLLSGPCGFFGGLRFLFGEERLFIMYYDDPNLIKEIAGHLCELWIAMIEELVPQVDFDIAGFWEDMAGKNGMLISPAIFREFMTPYYRRITDVIHSKGIKNIIVDCDGKVDELIPLFLEAGVNVIYPFEQQAGNDIIGYRKKYPQLVMWGGIDKIPLSIGKDAIKKELDKTAFLIKQGGYIPFVDHVVPPNVSWEDFKYYRESLNVIIENTNTWLCT